MVVELNNETFYIKVELSDSYVRLIGTVVMDSLPDGASKHPFDYALREDGKWEVHMEFFIPTGFIYDALQIEDKQIVSQFHTWLEDAMQDVWIQRNKRK